MKKFLCNSDFTIMGKILAHVGDEVIEDSTLKSEDGSLSIKMDIDLIKSNSCFSEIIEPLDIEIKEVPSEEEDMEKDWILQLKITTSRRKIRQIETFIRENLVKLI